MIEELTVTLKTSEDFPPISKLKKKSQFSNISGISETKSALDKGYYLWPGCDTF